MDGQAKTPVVDLQSMLPGLEENTLDHCKDRKFKMDVPATVAMKTSRSLQEMLDSIYDVGKNGGLNKSPTKKEIFEKCVAQWTKPWAHDNCCRLVYRQPTGEGTLSPFSPTVQPRGDSGGSL